jgi:alkyl sulfatase BDS1-like metallo-beta-lactamase superfamily hydrolase
MAEFLSRAWIDELDAAARAAADLTVATPFVVEQVVRDDGSDDVRYRMSLGPGGASVAVAPAAGDAPDLTLITDRATARALHEGQVRAQDALARGDLKVRGRPEVLAGRAELLGRLDAAFAPVRACTTFGDGR